MIPQFMTTTGISVALFAVLVAGVPDPVPATSGAAPLSVTELAALETAEAELPAGALDDATGTLGSRGDGIDWEVFLYVIVPIAAVGLVLVLAGN